MVRPAGKPQPTEIKQPEVIGRGWKEKRPEEVGEMSGQRKVTWITVIQDNYKLGFFQTISSLWDYIWSGSKNDDMVITTSEGDVQAAAPSREPGKAKVWQILDEMHNKELLTDKQYENLTNVFDNDHEEYTYPELQAKINQKIANFGHSDTWDGLLSSEGILQFWSEKFAAGRKAAETVPAISAVAATVIKSQDSNISTIQRVVDDMESKGVLNSKQAQNLIDAFTIQPQESLQEIKQRLDKQVVRFEQQQMDTWKAPKDATGNVIPGSTSVKDRMVEYWKERGI